MKKTVALAEAVERIQDGATVMISGFMGAGSPIGFLMVLVRQGRTGLTLISNATA